MIPTTNRIDWNCFLLGVDSECAFQCCQAVVMVFNQKMLFSPQDHFKVFVFAGTHYDRRAISFICFAASFTDVRPIMASWISG